MQRRGVYTVIASIAVQLTLGIAYLWSLFQDGVTAAIFGGNHAQAGLTFSLLLMTMTIGSVIGGRLAVKYGTRLVVFVGGLIMGAGFLSAAFVTSAVPWLLWLTYGVMGGVGMGFTYSTTIACAQKWYPHKKGLVSGIIVSALGFGGVIFTPVIRWSIGSFGGDQIGERYTFIVLSAIFVVVCIFGSLILRDPPKDYTPSSEKSTVPAGDVAPGASRPETIDLSPRQMLKTPHYYIVATTFALACMGGQMMIAFARPVAEARELSAFAVSAAVMSLAAFNSVGRLFWGVVSDKIGRLNTMVVLLSGTALLMLFVNLAQGVWVFPLVILIGFFYGGVLSNFPALTADLFGPKYMATNYGFVLLGFGVGAILATEVAGHFRNLATDNIDKMYPAFVIGSICAGLGVWLMAVMRGLNKKRR